MKQVQYETESIGKPDFPSDSEIHSSIISVVDTEMLGTPTLLLSVGDNYAGTRHGSHEGISVCSLQES